MSTAFVTDSRFAAHTMDGHPEYAARLTMIQALLESNELLNRLVQVEVEPVSEALMHMVHSADYLNLIKKTAKLTESTMLGVDTYVTPQSYDIARLAAGGVIRVVDAVLAHEVNNGLAAIRPPGHHATVTMGMGFCLLNNVALAARHALDMHDVSRVLIADYDVHHGNGTQDIFYDDPCVFYISTHQSPLYPGTGMLQESGHGEGAGTTLNIPLPAGLGDAGYNRVFDEVVIPAIYRFEPELILVSAGFDAHWADPLANMRLSLSGYSTLDQKLIAVANDLCQGRIIYVLEGGYNLQVLGNGWANVARALLGDMASMDDPLGASDQREPAIEQRLETIKQVHNLI